MSTDLDIFRNPASLVHAENWARPFADSQMVPERFRGKVADCLIGFALALQTGQNPLTVLQSLYIVNGTPGWSAQYIIAQANASGLFRGGIRWRVVKRKNADGTAVRLAVKRTKKEWPKGAPQGTRPTVVEVDARIPDMTVTAYATLAATGEEIEFEVDSEMAILEGWAQNEKYTGLCEPMLRYRSASFLVRFYAPHVMMGMRTMEEIETEPVERAEVSVVAAPVRGPVVATPQIAEGVPARDFLAEAEALKTRDKVPTEAAVETEVEAVETEVVEGAPKPSQEVVAATFASEVEELLAKTAKAGIDRAQLLAFFATKDVDLGAMEYKAARGVFLKVGSGGSWRAELDAFLAG